MGATMNLDEAQERQVASFSTGEPCVYSEGDDSALLIKFPFSKVAFQALTKAEENRFVRESMGRGNQQVEERLMSLDDSLMQIENLRKYGKEARQIVEEAEFKELMARYILSTVVREATLVEEFLLLVQLINKFRKSSNFDTGIVAFTLTCGVKDFFETRGQQYNWKFTDVEVIENMFASLIFGISFKRCNQNMMQQKLSDEEAKRVTLFQNHY